MEINENIENQKYCAMIFLNVTHTFDKVCYLEFLYTTTQRLPQNIFGIPNSYIEERYFLLKHQDAYMDLQTIISGVPQGSMLGIVYIIYNRASIV